MQECKCYLMCHFIASSSVLPASLSSWAVTLALGWLASLLVFIFMSIIAMVSMKSACDCDTTASLLTSSPHSLHSLSMSSSAASAGGSVKHSNVVFTTTELEGPLPEAVEMTR